MPLSSLFAAAAVAAAAHSAPVEPTTHPPAATARPVTDIYFGTHVTDRFRYMESRDAETTAWMEAQSRWTHDLLDTIQPKSSFQKAMSTFGGKFGIVSQTAVAGGRVFYLERAPGEDQYSCSC